MTLFMWPFFFLNHTPSDPRGLAGNKLSSYCAIYKKLCALLPPCITPAFASRCCVHLLCLFFICLCFASLVYLSLGVDSVFLTDLLDWTSRPVDSSCFAAVTVFSVLVNISLRLRGRLRP
jgi:hypothetical protein